VLIVDVNRTRVHLVYGEQNWRLEAGDAGLQYDRGSLILRPHPFVFPVRKAERPPTPDDRRGASRDRYGNWYWISADRSSIRFLGHEAAVSQHFWASPDRPVREAEDRLFKDDSPPPLRLPRTLEGLAVTTNHYLLVGAVEPPSSGRGDPGLFVFDLHGGGPPLELAWPDASFVSFDIASTWDGGAWILDRGHRTYLGVDCYLEFRGAPDVRPAAPIFTSVDPGAALKDKDDDKHGPVKPFELEGVTDPIAIEGLPDGSVLVLDLASATRCLLHHVLNGEPIEDPVELLLPAESKDEEPRPIRGHDMAFLPDDWKRPTSNGLVFVTAESGNQTFAFETHADGRLLESLPKSSYYPMRFAAGKALVATPQGPFYDLDDRWVPLAEQPMPRYAPTATLQLPRSAAAGMAHAFDGRQPRCVWHRLLIDACVPPGTSIQIESRAADSLSALAADSATPWQTEPPLYMRRDGSEIPFYRTPIVGKRDHTGTWELLFQRALGRYLQLRVTLSGSGRNTPRVHAIRAYYPRFSYLREYLPAIYREDEASASFLDRFLANVEGTYTAVEGRIEQAQALFDPRTVPPEYLEWLATWFGVALDPAWDENRRRLFLMHAHEMFLERGTVRGVTRAIQLALDPCVEESDFTDRCACGCGEASPFDVRVTEGFLARPTQASSWLLEDEAPGEQAGTRWTVAQGAAALHAQFAAFLEKQYRSLDRLNSSWSSIFEAFSEIRFPPRAPEHDIRRRDWTAFIRAGLSFPYHDVGPADEPALRSFLERRYPETSELRRAWGVQSLTEVRLPTTLPTGPALEDWITFVSSLSTERRAHYFTVFVPADLDDSDDTHAARLDLVRRVTAAVKPAHTEFDAVLYWALFRVGEVRVGFDTVLGRGSRFVSLVLGRTPLADGYLTAQTPGGERDRYITGRDPLGSTGLSNGSLS
jgi:phage tail-like protein